MTKIYASRGLVTASITVNLNSEIHINSELLIVSSDSQSLKQYYGDHSMLLTIRADRETSPFSFSSCGRAGRHCLALLESPSG